MVNFLIYDKVHWYDLPSNLKPEKTGYERNQDVINSKPISGIQKLNDLLKLENKYDAKWIKGDIYEVRLENLTMCGKEPLTYVLLTISDMTYEEGKQYHDSIRDGNVLKHNRRYNVDIDQIVFDKDKRATITKSQFLNLLTDKSLDLERVS
jgi:hypothetical protein